MKWSTNRPPRPPVYAIRQNLDHAIGQGHMSLLHQLITEYDVMLPEIEAACHRVGTTVPAVSEAWRAYVEVADLDPATAVRIETMLRQDPLFALSPLPFGGGW
ncbi:hypothetical protein [Stackebrandtia soli]|uniref:hypothetical protein n=1 Tax=Stackebrandtia soli TaxID=1892856 RepID=UPI0039E7476A